MFESDTKFSHWLYWFTADFEDSRMPSPFMLPNGMAAATNGRYAVATSDTPVPNAVPCEAQSAKVSGIAKDTQGALAVTPRREATISREQALAMFGEAEHPKTDVCTHCHGEKTVPHDCDCDLCTADIEDCDWCDGTGNKTNGPERRVRRIWGVPVDANNFSYVIAHAPPADSYVLRLSEWLGNQVFTLMTPEWYALIAPMSVDPGRDRELLELMDSTMVDDGEIAKGVGR